MTILPKIRISHITFSVVFCTLLYLVCNVFNVDDIAKWFRVGDSTDVEAVVSYYLFCLCLFILVFTVIFCHPLIVKPASVVLVVLSAMATYFITKYDISVDTSMVLNTVHTDVREIKALITKQMLPYFLFLVGVPLLIISRVEIDFKPRVRYLIGSAKLAAIMFLCAIAGVYLLFETLHRPITMSHKMIVHKLVPVNIIRSGYSALARNLKTDSTGTVEFDANLDKEQDVVVVLAIGETARRKSFSLYGYDRNNTTPKLDNHHDLHLLNGIAAQGSTLYALPEILKKNDVNLTAITDRVGIDTFCLVNFSLYDNCGPINQIEVSNCRYPESCYDEDVIPLLSRNLQSYESGSRFIVLHLGGGSHGPNYNIRIPQEFHEFKPTCGNADVVNECTREELFNSYDNTILYTDYVLDGILNDLDASGVPYIFIYLSDHGESLLEGGHLFHGMPPAVPLPPEQAEIPLIVKSSLPVKITPRDSYKQQDVFSTIIDLFGIKTPIFDSNGVFAELP